MSKTSTSGGILSGTISTLRLDKPTCDWSSVCLISGICCKAESSNDAMIISNNTTLKKTKLNI
ncbi:hypothetical protein HanRHA438_Chr11g0527991 [Helianthus annuus]|nr:hypothetical protein HanRHA438_Chr11g0527991 [Helianthus annuus]